MELPSCSFQSFTSVKGSSLTECPQSVLTSAEITIYIISFNNAPPLPCIYNIFTNIFSGKNITELSFKTVNPRLVVIPGGGGGYSLCKAIRGVCRSSRSLF